VTVSNEQLRGLTACCEVDVLIEKSHFIAASAAVTIDKAVTSKMKYRDVGAPAL